MRGKTLACGSLTFAENSLKHTELVPVNVTIDEPEHAIAFLVQPFGTLFVIHLALGVRVAVQFDDKTALRAEKVGYIRADGLLTAESESIELPVAEVPPKDSLRRRRLPAHGLGPAQELGIGMMLA